MIYELINPSDPVTFETEDIDVVRAVGLLLGSGQCPVEDEHGEEVLPLFIFGGYDKWAAAQGFDLATVRKDKLMAVVDCLRTAMVAERRERAAIMAAVGTDVEALARYNEERRSSMNDICGRAFAIADKLAASAAAAAAV